MQTFITDTNLKKSAKNLDNKRLGKQRVEALQIADCLLVKETRWKNHPAVKMWKGYESYLVKVYIKLIMNEWEKRGYKNTKCSEWWNKLNTIVKQIPVKKPLWINDKFIEAHKSNLVRKNKEYYVNLFPNVSNDISYAWPVNLVNEENNYV